MSTYIKLATLEYPRHEGDIRLEHPEIGADQTGATFPCPDTYALVEVVTPPNFDRVHQRIREGAPECVDGKWRMTWIVYDAPADEVANDPLREDLAKSGSAPNVIG